ncbi:FGGY family carbohydrate kinase [Micromonospora sp. 067-2]|uniref:FGGY family carbohydrate kinase n=1 Tax=Micromonospora sp. 067-2 TaxID=2789270 RepID=UPI00397CCFF5
MTAVCIDVGTTMIKAVGYDDDGVETVVVRRPAAVTRPQPGWAEQDMAAVWETVVAATRAAVDRLPGAVQFLAVTAQGDGSWLVDAHGQPTGPAILWNDGRAADVVDGWTRSGVLAKAFRINGSLTFAGLPNAILAWLRAHDPDRLDRSALSLTCGGWIVGQLTGELAVDESDASAPFLAIRQRTYSAELLQLHGLGWAEHLLPPVCGDDRRVGGLHPRAAAALGLPAGLPVVRAPYDIAATAIGVGAVRPGQSSAILGTTLCTQTVTATVDLDGREPAGLTVALGLPGRYLRAFPTLAGGEVVQWACRLLGLADPTQLTELALGGASGAGGLSFLPYLSPAGERAPFLDPLVRGAFVGLSVEHRPEHVARAVLEGLSFVVRDCLDATGTAPTELLVSGGGAASTGWLRLIADVTGVPVRRGVDAEAGARGAYLIGLVATGRATDVESAVTRFVRARDSFEPVPAQSARYAELFEDFRFIRRTLAPLGPRLATMRAGTVAA